MGGGNGGGSQYLDPLARLALSPEAASPRRRFCAVGSILGIFYKNAVSQAGSAI